MSATLEYLNPRSPSSARILLPWTAAVLIAASLVFGLDFRGKAHAGGGRGLFVVLTEEEGRPGRTAYEMPMPRAAEADELERSAGEDRLRRLESLRALYTARAEKMDVPGLRRALMLGAKYGDDLARSLLLENLCAALPSPEALGALGTVADLTSNRIGPIGASRIALAYAHLGDAEQASVWAKRAAEGPRGIPSGLLDLTGGGALQPGRIAGRVNGLKPKRIGLYRKTDPGAPYLLDAAALVASAEPDGGGRFAFSGLAAGRYYLAFALEQTASPLGEIAVSGHRGDVALDARRTAADLAPLTFKPAPR